MTQWMRPRVLFIAGLTHSRTTLLDVLLSRHPDVVGLGESWGVMADCPFWSIVRTRPVEEKPPDIRARYEMARIFEFMDLEPPAEGHAKPNHHIALGNLGVRRAELHEVRYDHRWFRRSNWLLPMLLLPQVRRYNPRLYDRVHG